MLDNMTSTVIGAIGAIISFLAAIIVTIVSWVVKTHVSKLDTLSNDVDKHDESLIILKGKTTNDDKNLERLENGLHDIHNKIKEHESLLIKLGIKLDMIGGKKND